MTAFACCCCRCLGKHRQNVIEKIEGQYIDTEMPAVVQTTQGVVETIPDQDAQQKVKIERGILAYPEIDDGVREVNEVIDYIRDLILPPPLSEGSDADGEYYDANDSNRSFD